MFKFQFFEGFNSFLGFIKVTLYFSAVKINSSACSLFSTSSSVSFDFNVFLFSSFSAILLSTVCCWLLVFISSVISSSYLWLILSIHLNHLWCHFGKVSHFCFFHSFLFVFTLFLFLKNNFSTSYSRFSLKLSNNLFRLIRSLSLHSSSSVNKCCSVLRFCIMFSFKSFVCWFLRLMLDVRFFANFLLCFSHFCLSLTHGLHIGLLWFYLYLGRSYSCLFGLISLIFYAFLFARDLFCDVYCRIHKFFMFYWEDIRASPNAQKKACRKINVQKYRGFQVLVPQFCSGNLDISVTSANTKIMLAATTKISSFHKKRYHFCWSLWRCCRWEAVAVPIRTVLPTVKTASQEAVCHWLGQQQQDRLPYLPHLLLLAGPVHF